MPKDKDIKEPVVTKEEVKVEEPKKKMVVVEEIDPIEETPKVEESPKVTDIPAVPDVAKEVNPKRESVEIPASMQNQPEETEKTNYLWIIIPTALLIGALVGGLITYFSGLSRLGDSSATATPVATVAPVITEATPSATPSSSTVSRGDIKLQVLNGSGVSGLAGKAKAYLEGLGYKDVQTGNGSKSDMTETIISVKDSKKDSLSTVITDVSKNYKVAKSTEVLSASSKYDFVITLGSQ